MIQDVTVPEAVPLSDIDEALVKSGYAESLKVATSAADGSMEKAQAQIEVLVFSAMGRAIGITL